MQKVQLGHSELNQIRVMLGNYRTMLKDSKHPDSDVESFKVTQMTELLYQAQVKLTVHKKDSLSV